MQDHPPSLQDQTAAVAQWLEPLDTPSSAPLRLFSVWEICTYLIPVAAEHLRRSLRQNPKLPQGVEEGKARWFTLADIITLRRFFAQTGRGKKTYLPYRPDGQAAQVITLTGAAAQAGQTTACVTLATRAAMAGYRVLAVDLNPNAGLTAQLPGRATEPASQAPAPPLMARHFAEHLQSENRARLARGGDPLPVDEALSAPLSTDTQALIRPTLWHRLDLMPAGPATWGASVQAAHWLRQAPGWPYWQMLRDRLQADGVMQRYDLIIVDTGAALDPITLAAVALADHLILPVQVQENALHVWAQRITALSQEFTTLQTRLNTAARALGTDEVRLGQVPATALMSRTAPDQARAALPLRAALAEQALPHDLPQTAHMPPVGGFYALDPRTLPRDVYVATRAPLEALWGDIAELISTGWARD